MTENIKKNLSLRERVQIYEKLENSLRDFFNSSKYCEENCFSKEKAVIGWKRALGNILAPGNEACCYEKSTKFYDFSNGLDGFYNQNNGYKEEFQQKQLENIKENFAQQGTCKYHTSEGCAIEKFRSPKCNSWICESYKDHLSSEYNIFYFGDSYSDNSVKYLLGIVFEKKIDLNQIDKTISNLKKATKRIEMHNKNKKYDWKIVI